MPLGGENSEKGKIVDYKEGLYLGDEHSATDSRVVAGLPTFGSNVLPDDEIPEMRAVLQRYLKAMRQLGDQMMDLLSLALGLEENYLQAHVTELEPVLLPRMFRYLPQVDSSLQQRHDQALEDKLQWGIGSHSDYGLWTMILSDAEGLEFLHPLHGWCAVPQVVGGITMNVGDVLDRLTQGHYRSAYHRARNHSTTQARLSLPFFYDPAWNARMKTLPVSPITDPCEVAERDLRWSQTKIRCTFDGQVQYSEFLAKKVAKVFPDVVPRTLWQNFESTSEPSSRHTLVVSAPEKLNTSMLLTEIESNRQKVLKHPLYQSIQAIAANVDDDSLHLVRRFMEHHVWAVWDYFQLLKRLQAELTCVAVPWRPATNSQLCRFINEIVLEEESDLFEDGVTHGSHLELYLRGMHQAGADTGPMRRFLQRLPHVSGQNASMSLAEEAANAGAPKAAVDHIQDTLRLALEGSAAEVAAVFTFGREDVIPSMFASLLPLDRGNHDHVSIFRYYLERHIELDGKDHGPLAIRLVEVLCGTSNKDPATTVKWGMAVSAVNRALCNRCALWSAVGSSEVQHQPPAAAILSRM